MHERCGKRCGAFLRGERSSTTSASTADVESSPLRTRCTAAFCTKDWLRQPTCCYDDSSDDDNDDSDSDAELRHAPRAVLCDEHISACAYCRIAVCDRHTATSDNDLPDEYRMHECGNCSAYCCEMHSVQCAYDCPYDCMVCGGLKRSETGDKWNEVYEYDYLCKFHRARERIESWEQPDSPHNSPTGEPMTKKTRRRWARDSSDPRFK